MIMIVMMIIIIMIKMVLTNTLFNAAFTKCFGNYLHGLFESMGVDETMELHK